MKMMSDIQTGNEMEYRSEKSLEIAGRIAIVKTDLSLSNNLIAEKTNVSEITVSRYLRGKLRITKAWLNRFSDSYHIDCDWLVSGDGEPRYTELPKASEVKDRSKAGERVLQMRSELKLNQKDVCDVLDIKRVMYSRIENGKSLLTEENARKLEEAYGYGSEWLLYGDETKKEFPVTGKMIEWLWDNKEERQKIWAKMSKNMR